MSKKNRKQNKSVSAAMKELKSQKEDVTMVGTTDEIVNVTIDRETARQLEERFLGTTTENPKENVPTFETETVEEVPAFSLKGATIDGDTISKKTRRTLELSMNQNPELTSALVFKLMYVLEQQETDENPIPEIIEERAATIVTALGIDLDTDIDAVKANVAKKLNREFILNYEAINSIMANLSDTVFGNLIAWILTGDVTVGKKVSKFVKEMSQSFDKLVNNESILELVELVKGLDIPKEEVYALIDRSFELATEFNATGADVRKAVASLNVQQVDSVNGFMALVAEEIRKQQEDVVTMPTPRPTINQTVAGFTSPLSMLAKMKNPA